MSLVMMVTLDWLMGQLNMMDALKYAIGNNGGPSVTTSLEILMHKWPVDS